MSELSRRADDFHRSGDEKRIGLFDIGRAANLSERESTIVADYLQERGLIRVHRETDLGDGFVSLTLDGLEEIERLAAPGWRRLLSQPGVVGAIAGAIGGLLSGVLLSVVKSLFGLP